MYYPGGGYPGLYSFQQQAQGGAIAGELHQFALAVLRQIFTVCFLERSVGTDGNITRVSTFDGYVER